MAVCLIRTVTAGSLTVVSELVLDSTELREGVWQRAGLLRCRFEPG